MALDLVEGWTGDLDFVLKVNGVARAWVGGDAVSLILKTQDGRLIDTDGNVSIVAAGGGVGDGTVRYSPDAGDLKAKDAPYLARFKVVTGGKVVFFPNGAEDVWGVRTP